MPKTHVVNIQNDRCEVYIGRGGPFGNPYIIGKHGDRTEVIRKFRIYFHDRLKKDHVWKEKVDKLSEKTLGCFCRPPEGFQGKLLCHGQIMAGYLDDVPPEQVT